MVKYQIERKRVLKTWDLAGSDNRRKMVGSKRKGRCLHCASAYCWVLLLEINQLKSLTRYFFFKSRRRASNCRGVWASAPAVVTVVGALSFKEGHLESHLKGISGRCQQMTTATSHLQNRGSPKVTS